MCMSLHMSGDLTHLLKLTQALRSVCVHIKASCNQLNLSISILKETSTQLDFYQWKRLISLVYLSCPTSGYGILKRREQTKHQNTVVYSKKKTVVYYLHMPSHFSILPSQLVKARRKPTKNLKRDDNN